MLRHKKIRKPFEYFISWNETSMKDWKEIYYLKLCRNYFTFNLLVIRDILKLFVFLFPLHFPFVQVVWDRPIRVLNERADVGKVFRFNRIRTPTDQQVFGLFTQIFESKNILSPFIELIIFMVKIYLFQPIKHL